MPRRRIQVVVALLSPLFWLAFFPVCGMAQSAPPSTPQGKPEVVIQGGHAAPVMSVAFSPDGRLLASGGADSIVILWETTTAHQLRTLTGHTGTVLAVAFSPDGRWLASSGQDNVVKIWEVASGRNLRNLAIEKREGEMQGFAAIAFSPDGRWLAAGNVNNTVKVWEAASGHDVATLTPQGAADPLLGVTAVAFSPDGQLLLTGHGDGIIRLWQAATGRELRTLASPPPARQQTPQQKAMIEAASKESDASGPNPEPQASPQEKAIADQMAGVAGALGDALTARIDAVAFSPDGHSAAAVVGDDVKLWDSLSGQELRHFPLPIEPTALALAMAKDLGPTADPRPGAVAFSADGRMVAYQTGDQTVKVRDVKTARETLSLTVPADQDSMPICLALSLSRDGRWLAWADLGNNIKLWDLTTRKPK